MINSKARWGSDCCAENYIKCSHERTGINLRASGSTMATINRLKKTFSSKKVKPPSLGSSDWAVTAEKVVNPAQNPGNNRWRSSVIPLRSIKTRSAAASATPIRFAVSVPFRLSVIAIPSANLTKVPATPPMETSSNDFSSRSLS